MKFFTWFFIFISLTSANAICAETINCNDPQQNEELIYCSRVQLDKSMKNYKALTGSLNESSVIQSSSLKNKLLEKYAESIKLFRGVCNSASGGRLKEMYYNNCLSTQVDLINKSIQALICVQQDAEGC